MTSGPHLLPRQIAKLAYESGFIDADKLFIMTAITIAESNGYSKARHTNPDGSIDRGLLQINDRAHPDISDIEADDPVKAMAWARKIYEGRNHTFTAWSAYTNLAYLGPRAASYAAQGVANFLLVKHGLPIV